MRPHSATERADMETLHLQRNLSSTAPETPALRRAGCVARKSGSVGGVPGRPGAPTRQARVSGVGTLSERRGGSNLPQAAPTQDREDPKIQASSGGDRGRSVASTLRRGELMAAPVVAELALPAAIVVAATGWDRRRPWHRQDGYI